jgi:hypothetical protein
MLAGLVVAVAGCTVSNPGYQASDDAAVVAELGGGSEAGADDLEAADRQRGDGKLKKDWKPTPDTHRWYDIKPTPDSVPWQCSKASDCDDKLDCTLDLCNSQKKCENTLQSGCLIFGACFGEGDANPLNPCERCLPAKSATSWSAASDGTSCPGDGLSCTVDTCDGGLCKHALSSSACLIGGVCVDDGDSNPKNSCEECSPADDQEDWSAKKDGSSCSSDGRWCTTDTCKAGACTHPVSSKACLVGSQCYYEGQSQGNNPCQECVPTASSSTLTFVAGKPCVPSSQAGAIAGMCFKSKCAPWVEKVFEPTVPGPNSVLSSAFNAVDYVPISGQVWAAGEYTTSLISGGVIRQLGASAISVPVITANRFRGLKHRLAVGDGGIAMVHDGLIWVHQAKIEAYLGGLYRAGVWGTALANGTETFFLAGNQGASQAAMVRCTIGSDTTCVDHTGFQNGVQVGPVFGALSAGGLGVWSLPLSTSTDIYFNAGTGPSWSYAVPQGCADLGNTTSSPCSQTTGAWRDLHASGPSDVWAVGASGLMMRWDGAKWVRYSNVLASQSSHTLTAVYSSPGDGLVTVAATSWSFNGRWVYLFNYNQALARWLGPIVLVEPGNNNTQDEVRDLGGQSYSALWAVGVRQVGSSTGSPRNQAWTVQLKP